MKILFLVFHGFDAFNGISKKIGYQIEALRILGHQVELGSLVVDFRICASVPRGCVRQKV